MCDTQNYGTKCDHKDHSRNKGEKLNSIRRVLQNHPEGVLAKIVANETKAPKVTYSTVRKYLPELVEMGDAYQEHGTKLYKSVTNETYGVTGSPKVQNVRLRYVCPNGTISEHKKVTEIMDTIKMQVTLGKTHNLATTVISAEPPMSLRELKVMVCTFRRIIKEKIGLDVMENVIEVSEIELITDFRKIRLDGLNAITLISFFGYMEKWYNKKENMALL